MDKNIIKDKMLRELDFFGIIPTRIKYGMELRAFLEILNEMANDEEIIFTIIGEHPTHKGEVKNILITEKGREYIRDKIKLTEEQLNFLARLNIQGPLTSDYLGDTIDSDDCDEKAEEQCKLMEESKLIYKKDFGYSLTERGFRLIKNRKTYKTTKYSDRR